MASQAVRSVGGTFLTRVLEVNATITGILGVAITVGFQALAAAFGLHPTFLLAVGIICLLTAAAVAWLLAIGQMGNQFALVLASSEVIWVALSFAALGFGWLTPTPLGWWAIVLQADLYAIFAALEFYLVRKARGR